MTKKEIRKKIDQFIAEMNEAGCSVFMNVSQGNELISSCACGDIRSIGRGFVEILSDATAEDATDSMRVVALHLCEVVTQFQRSVIGASLGFSSQEEERDADNITPVQAFMINENEKGN